MKNDNLFCGEVDYEVELRRCLNAIKRRPGITYSDLRQYSIWWRMFQLREKNREVKDLSGFRVFRRLVEEGKLFIEYIPLADGLCEFRFYPLFLEGEEGEENESI